MVKKMRRDNRCQTPPATEPGRRVIKHRWRDYSTASGNRPVYDFLMNLPDGDRAAIAEVMEEIRALGLDAARHIRGDIYEARAHGLDRILRIMFAPEGRHGQVLLALVGFVKKSQKTPEYLIRLAETRLRDWRERGKQRRMDNQ